MTPQEFINLKYQQCRDGIFTAIGTATGPASNVFKSVTLLGMSQDFGNATISFIHGQSEAFVIHGLIRAKWLLNNNVDLVGYPTSDEIPTSTGNGRWSHFTNADIVWKSRANEAFVVANMELALWAGQNKDRGPLGYPLSDNNRTHPGGSKRFTLFEGGVIHNGTSIIGPWLGVSNASPIPCNFRFYHSSDTNHPVATPLRLETVAVNDSFFMRFPRVENALLVTFNGNLRRPAPLVPEGLDRVTTMLPNQHVIFSDVDTITIFNPRGAAGNIRIFNATDPLNIFALPGGEFALQPNPIAVGIYQMPDNVQQVKVFFNNVLKGRPFRGGGVFI